MSEAWLQAAGWQSSAGTLLLLNIRMALSHTTYYSSLRASSTSVTGSSTPRQLLLPTLLLALRSTTTTPAEWQLLPGLVLDHTVLSLNLVHQRMVCISERRHPIVLY